MACFVAQGPAKPLGEAKNAFMTESILADPILKLWLINLYKSVDRFDLVSRVFIRNNIRLILGKENLAEHFKNEYFPLDKNGVANPAYKVRKRQIEDELAMRTARLHNGGGAPFATNLDQVTRACTAGNPCDTGNYVSTFIGSSSGRGDWRSLRCGEIKTLRGLQLIPLLFG
jgi:hypothetical protein